MPELANLTDAELRYRIAGTTDWTDAYAVSRRILDMPDEVFAEVERRDVELAELRWKMRALDGGGAEFSAAAQAYVDRFKAWLGV